MPHTVARAPHGDLSAQRDAESRKVSRKLKTGKAEHAGSWLPYHPTPMQGDTPGISVRQAPKDEVA